MSRCSRVFSGTGTLPRLTSPRLETPWTRLFEPGLPVVGSKDAVFAGFSPVSRLRLPRTGYHKSRAERYARHIQEPRFRILTAVEHKF
jgi:hypothetical protein